MFTAEAYWGYETIRAQALELFVNKGFGQVSMRELARHVGLAPGSLYNHFPSKQGAWEALPHQGPMRDSGQAPPPSPGRIGTIA